MSFCLVACLWVLDVVFSGCVEAVCGWFFADAGRGYCSDCGVREV